MKARGLDRDPLAERLAREERERDRVREEMIARSNKALGVESAPVLVPAAPPVTATTPPPTPLPAPAPTADAMEQQDEPSAASEAPTGAVAEQPVSLAEQPAGTVERPAPAEQPEALEQPSPAAPERRRTVKGTRTGTFGNPYERLDGVRTAKVSFQASLEFFQEMRRFEAELPPKTRNEWMEKALRQAIARTRRRWQLAAEAKAAGKPPPADDED